MWFGTEDRTPRVVLEANPFYWNTARGARLRRVVFRNDIPQREALELVCTTTGEVDIVTNVAPEDAKRVIKSEHARLVERDAMRVIVGIINRAGDANPFADLRARQALNHAIDRAKLIDEGLAGYGEPSAGLTPSWTLSFLSRLTPYAHDPRRAAKLWRGVKWRAGRRLKLAAANEHYAIARLVARDIEDALDIEVDLKVFSDEEKIAALGELTEKRKVPAWDIFLYGWSGQTADAPPLELHYQFVGRRGAWRAGAGNKVFERMYDDFTRQTNPIKQANLAARLDKFVYDEALALFLCSPQALYAVNKEVDFTPYATTFELAECEVGGNHWSRQGNS